MQWLRFGGEVYAQAPYDQIRLFSFTSDLTLRHDSRAPRSVKRSDLQLSQGLAVSF